ncbi:MAG: C4-dicarboxylate ABC transporter permease, partial [Bacteroidetes bacterium]|nr:C4-dicarboxylate ABC transporter permease [Bacteroidota bacterium]
MSSVGIALLMLGLVLFLIFMGARIAVALLAVSVLGSWLITGDFFAAAAGILGMGPFYVTFNYSLAVIPLFLLMGIF